LEPREGFAIVPPLFFQATRRRLRFGICRFPLKSSPWKFDVTGKLPRAFPKCAASGARLGTNGSSMSDLEKPTLHTARHGVWLLLIVAVSGCYTPGRTWYGGVDHVAVANMKKYGPCGWEKVEKLKTMRGVSPAEQEVFVPQLISQLASENDTYVRIEILQTLRGYTVPSAQQVFYAGLKDPDPEIRALCCDCLGKHPSPVNAKALAEAMASDTNVDVRLAAAEALGKNRDPIALKALSGGLQDSDPAMQYRAVESLKLVTGRTDLGDDVNEWRRYVDSNPSLPAEQKSIAGVLGSWF
jgi:hypothetical protein